MSLAEEEPEEGVTLPPEASTILMVRTTLPAVVFPPGDLRMTGALREGRGEACTTSCAATTCSTGTPRVVDTRRSRSPSWDFLATSLAGVLVGESSLGDGNIGASSAFLCRVLVLLAGSSAAALAVSTFFFATFVGSS